MLAAHGHNGIGSGEAALRTPQLSHLWDTAILSLRTVRQQAIAAVRPAVGVDALHARPSLGDANECALVARDRFQISLEPEPDGFQGPRPCAGFPPQPPSLRTFRAGRAQRRNRHQQQERCTGAAPSRPDKASLGPAEKAFAGTVRRLADALAADQAVFRRPVKAVTLPRGGACERQRGTAAPSPRAKARKPPPPHCSFRRRPQRLNAPPRTGAFTI
jgi:hypothetical protein